MNTAPDAQTIPWAAWKASELNSVFHEQGRAGSVSRITAATVRHGERTIVEGTRAEGTA
jgi:hypothetical protein